MIHDSDPWGVEVLSRTTFIHLVPIFLLLFQAYQSIIKMETKTTQVGIEGLLAISFHRSRRIPDVEKPEIQRIYEPEPSRSQPYTLATRTDFHGKGDDYDLFTDCKFLAFGSD